MAPPRRPPPLPTNASSAAGRRAVSQGYLAVTLLLTENSDLVRMVINSMRQDLVGRDDVFTNLALAAVANIGGREMADALHQDVYKLLVSSSSKPSVKKRAALCLLRLFRKNPDGLPASDWADKIIPLLEDGDLVRARRPPPTPPTPARVMGKGGGRRGGETARAGERTSWSGDRRDHDVCGNDRAWPPQRRRS